MTDKPDYSGQYRALDEAEQMGEFEFRFRTLGYHKGWQEAVEATKKAAKIKLCHWRGVGGCLGCGCSRCIAIDSLTITPQEIEWESNKNTVPTVSDSQKS